MAFMELETEHGVWYTVETSRGESFLIPESVCGYLPIPSGHTTVTEDDCPPEDWESICDAVRDYTDGNPVREVSAQSGWCARYSAPGYLDCTDWTGPCETEEEAIKDCKDVYDDSDDEDAV